MRLISISHLKVAVVGSVFIVTAESLALLHFAHQANIAEAGLVFLHWCDRYLHRAKAHETIGPIA